MATFYTPAKACEACNTALSLPAGCTCAILLHLATFKGGLFSSVLRAWCYMLQLESLKVFSTAERLGLLSTVERLLVADPAVISSLAIPLFVASVGALSL